MPKKKTLVIIFGPTGVGKTDISIDIAEYFNSEIFSSDSRQMYRELDIGVAKPNISQLNKIKHHFINSVSVYEHYSIYQYEADVIKSLNEYFLSNDIAIMTGGSGLYVDAVCNGVDEMPDHDPEIRQSVNDFYQKHGLEALRFELKKHDPNYYNEVDLRNPIRIIRALEMFHQTGIPFSEFRKKSPVQRDFNIIKIGIDLDRDKLYDQINNRVDKMMTEGLLQEAHDLHQIKNLTALKTIGYRELFDYFDKKCSLNEAVELIKKNTRNYAKRQLTWFRRYQDASWFKPNEIKDIIAWIESQITNNK